VHTGTLLRSVRPTGNAIQSVPDPGGLRIHPCIFHSAPENHSNSMRRMTSQLSYQCGNGGEAA
jgi:hypothetical protein